MKKLILASLILFTMFTTGCSDTESSNTADYIGEDKALSIVMSEFLLSKDSISDVQVSLEDSCFMRDEYDVSFELHNHTYEYEVDAVSGDISYISVS